MVPKLPYFENRGDFCSLCAAGIFSTQDKCRIKMKFPEFNPTAEITKTVHATDTLILKINEIPTDIYISIFSSLSCASDGIFRFQ